MKWVRRFLFSLMLVLSTVPGMYAQTAEPAAANNADNDDRTVLMRNEFSGGLVLHSSGLGITLRRSKQKTVKIKRYIEFDFVSMKNPKEVSSQNPYYDNSTDFIYGKLNDFYVARIGVGRQQVIFAKAHTTGVEVRWHYGVGAALGITKPIYLNILVPETSTVQNSGSPQAYSVAIERYDPITQTPDVIYGNAPFTNGLGGMSLHPGGYIKSGLSFEYAKYADRVWLIETGVVLDVYPQDIPIMETAIPNSLSNHQVFLNFYVSISGGGKW